MDKESGTKTERFNEDIKKACEPLGNGKKVYVTYSNGVWNYSGNYQTNWSPTDGIRKK
ncbi:hypothetical protein MHF_0744 [Mycoplasma haemofelis Ohio2]|uniref:Uncharacterized protein n=1 Tax=Mycoplasma haemofelis (strain Ohio2) TaxID=859194 RepID=F6FIG6_MYCHI|nr:hypothetical protein MHF_0744 [Mycoplasma haemofelis Ohio2]